MSDRLPGSSYDNPIWYREYRIYLSNIYELSGYKWEFVHNDFDGAPDGNDRRCGHGKELIDCQQAIDEIEDGE